MSKVWYPWFATISTMQRRPIEGKIFAYTNSEKEIQREAKTSCVRILVAGRENDDGIFVSRWVCDDARMEVWGKGKADNKEDLRVTARLRQGGNGKGFTEASNWLRDWFFWGFVCNNGELQMRGKFLRSTMKVDYDL